MCTKTGRPGQTSKHQYSYLTGLAGTASILQGISGLKQGKVNLINTE